MNNELEKLIPMSKNLLEKWRLDDVQKCLILGIPDLGCLNLLRSERSLDDDNILIIRIHKLLEIHALLRTLFPGNLDLAYDWMRQNNEFFRQSPIDFVLKSGASDNELDRVIDYLKSHCFR